jgi:hypothetical protein
MKVRVTLKLEHTLRIVVGYRGLKQGKFVELRVKVDNLKRLNSVGLEKKVVR